MTAKPLSLIVALLMTLCPLPAVSADKTLDGNILDIPVYAKMQFIDYVNIKEDIQAARFCSNASVAEISRFYKDNFKNALEVQEGTADGMKQKILLDVTSPVKWREAKKFIEIYTDSRKNTCKTIVIITGVQTIANISTESSASPVSSTKREHIGLGGYVNTLNFSAGPTLIIWPTENIAVQGSYGVGTFASYEARGLYRFNIQSKLKPYFGAGYIHTDRQATVIGVDTTISGDSFSIFGGIETAIYKNIYLYADVSGTPMKLEKNVVSSTQSATAKVEYVPVTVGVGVILYLW